ncbi:MAG: cupredoxin domain-containing protein [Acidimicrobiia bacterium]|nr:cupredoxin domain-containing protein [Acidimicrobiia bacterium]
MKRWRAGVTAVTLAVTVGGACGDGGSPGPEDFEADFEVGGAVAVEDFRFSPDDVTVATGQLVRFTNEGDEIHTVTADDDTFDAGELEPGDVFTYDTARDEPGAIGYHCAIHPEMRGTMTIESARG